MNAFTPFYDVSAAGSMAASLCARGARERASADEAPEFAAAPGAPGPAVAATCCAKTGWRRVAGLLFDLISGPTYER